MIGHFCEVMARAILGALGFKIGARRLGRCGLCDTYVYDDETRDRVRGLWFHADCARYRRRAV